MISIYSFQLKFEFICQKYNWQLASSKMNRFVNGNHSLSRINDVINTERRIDYERLALLESRKLTPDLQTIHLISCCHTIENPSRELAVNPCVCVCVTLTKTVVLEILN